MNKERTMDWSFLDKLNKNLLYVYAKSLNKKGVPYFSRELFDMTHSFEGDVYQLDEKKELYLAEKWRETAYYLIWFVYRYILVYLAAKGIKSKFHCYIHQKIIVCFVFIVQYDT